MKKISIITLCTLLMVGSQQFIQTMHEEAPVGEKSSAQAQHEQVVADHQATTAKQQAILESSKSTATQKVDAQNTIEGSKVKVMDSHAKVLNESGGGLDMSAPKEISHQYTDLTSAKSMSHTMSDANTSIKTTFDPATGKATSSVTTDRNTGEVVSKTTYTSDPKSGIERARTVDVKTGDVVTKSTNSKTGTQITETVNKATGETLTEQTNSKTGNKVTTISSPTVEKSIFTDGKTGKEITEVTDVNTREVTRTELTKEQVAARDKAQTAEAPQVEAAKEVNKTDAEKKTEAKVIELEAKALNVTTPEEGQAVIAEAVGAKADAMGIKDPTTITQVKTEIATETKGVNVSKPGVFTKIMDSIGRMLGKSAPKPVAKQVNLF